MMKFEILEESKKPLIEGPNKEWRKLLRLKTREAVRLNPQLLEEVDGSSVFYFVLRVNFLFYFQGYNHAKIEGEG